MAIDWTWGTAAPRTMWHGNLSNQWRPAQEHLDDLGLTGPCLVDSAQWCEEADGVVVKVSLRFDTRAAPAEPEPPPEPPAPTLWDDLLSKVSE